MSAVVACTAAVVAASPLMWHSEAEWGCDGGQSDPTSVWPMSVPVKLKPFIKTVSVSSVNSDSTEKVFVQRLQRDDSEDNSGGQEDKFSAGSQS